MLTPLIRLTLFLVGLTMLLGSIEAYETGVDFLISPNKGLSFLLLVLAIAHWIIAPHRLPRNAKSLWICAFYLSLALSTMYAVIEGSDWRFLLIRWTTYLSMFFFYFLMCYVIHTRRELDLFCVALLLSGVISSVSAYFSEGVGGYWNPIRKSGVGFGHNHAAANLLMVLPLTYALATSVRSRIAKILLLTTAMILVIGFALALSRSAFIAALCMGVLFFFHFRRIPDIRLVVAVAILGLVAVIASPEGYVERLKTLTPAMGISKRPRSSTFETDNFAGRMRIYKASLVGFATHPILGVGTERYLDWVASYDAKLAGGFSIHNAILSVACQQGMFGLIPYLTLIIMTYRDFSRAQKLARSRRDLRDPELSALYTRAVMSQIGYIGILVVAQFQPGTFWRGIWVMFAFSTIILSLTRERLQELSTHTMSQASVGPAAPLHGYLPQPAGGFTVANGES